MKNKKKLLTLVAFFMLNIIVTKAYFYEIGYECQEENCISGQDINWKISFENLGQKEIKIVGVELIDSINHVQIAGLIFDYDPSKSDKLNYLEVSPGKKETIYIKSKVPQPNLKNQLVYMPCITTAMPTTVVKYVESYTHRVCYLNESITVFECMEDNDCKISELCKNKKCIKIVCKECQYILNRECIDYECCISETCRFDESCINNKCIALNCSQDEKISNHSCVRLECGYDEHIVNHECVKLECGDYEGYASHSCVRLECGYDEHIVNHECVKLECGFFEKTAVNKCVTDKDFVYKFAIEMLIVISIMYLFILDMKRYKSKHEK